MSPEDTIAYDNYWNQVKAGTTPEQRYDLKTYYNINGTSNYKINVQTNSKVDVNGTPNTITRRVDKNGNIVSDRIYGSDGKVLRDIDYDQHGNSAQHPWAPHIHDWINGVRQK